MKILLCILSLSAFVNCFAQENKEDKYLNFEIGLHYYTKPNINYISVDTTILTLGPSSSGYNNHYKGYGIEKKANYHMAISYCFNITNFLGIKTGLMFSSFTTRYYSSKDSLQKYYQQDKPPFIPYYERPIYLKSNDYNLILPIYTKFKYKRLNFYAGMNINIIYFRKTYSKYLDGEELESTIKIIYPGDKNFYYLYECLTLGLSYTVNTHYPAEIFVNYAFNNDIFHFGIMIPLYL